MATEHHACVILVLRVYKLASVTHLTEQVIAQLPRALSRINRHFQKFTEFYLAFFLEEAES